MTRTRERVKGRRGGEGERFAYMPESVLQSPALATAPHAAFRILAILLVGKSKDRNGLMMCSETYAAKFGINSRETVSRCLADLEARGLIERTRRVQRFRKAATLWACTWWPIAYRDGEPLQVPEPASHRYLQWKAITPMVGVEAQESSHRWSDSLTPMVGVGNGTHHTDGEAKGPIHHPDGRGHSKNLGRGTRTASGLGAQLAAARAADALAIARERPGIDPGELAKLAKCPLEAAHLALQSLQALASNC
jgi:hypothetical protein